MDKENPESSDIGELERRRRTFRRYRQIDFGMFMLFTWVPDSLVAVFVSLLASEILLAVIVVVWVVPGLIPSVRRRVRAKRCNCWLCGIKTISNHKDIGACMDQECNCCTSVTGMLVAFRTLGIIPPARVMLRTIMPWILQIVVTVIAALIIVSLGIR